MDKPHGARWRQMNTEMCRHCGNEMKVATTTFSVVKDASVYVVKDVPCLQCVYCEDYTFDQAVADKLYRLASGRVVPQPYRQGLNAWVYSWKDPVVELPSEPAKTNIENSRLELGRGTPSGTIVMGFRAY